MSLKAFMSRFPLQSLKQENDWRDGGLLKRPFVFVFYTFHSMLDMIQKQDVLNHNMYKISNEPPVTLMKWHKFRLLEFVLCGIMYSRTID